MKYINTMSNDKLAVIKTQLEQVRPTFEQLNLTGLDFNKEVEFAVQILNKNDYLAGAKPESIMNSLKNIALTGLSLNPVLKYSYLIPRKNKGVLECVADVSYIGLCKILTDTGSVKSIKAAVVYSNEPFDIELGSGGFVKHKPYFGPGGKGNRLGCYSVATLHDGSYHIHWMYAEDINRIKQRSEAVKAGRGSVWDSDEDEMWKKTCIKQHTKTLPKTERAEAAANAVALDNENHGIDFNAEKRQAQQEAAKEKAETLNIDLLDPNNEEHKKTFESFIALFSDPILPETLNDGQINVKQQAESFQKSFDAGTLNKDMANNWFKYIKAEIKKLKSQPKEEGEQKDEEIS